MTNNHLIIMAGGMGSRFWPMSTPDKPKQFIDILGTGKSLLQQTVARFLPVCPVENMWIVTAGKFADTVREQVPGLPDSHILPEPCMRNTAPCIAYAVWKIKKKHPEANIVISPSDHVVMNETEFVRVIRKGLEFTAAGERILTLGIKPTRPETGYGYIKLAAPVEEEIFRVEAFREKPDRKTAEAYLQAGGYTWNAGIFIWKASVIEQAFRKFQPELAGIFDRLEEVFFTGEEEKCIAEVYPGMRKISIDYAVMEQADNVYVLPADFGWSDLGTWGTLHALSGRDEHANAVIGSGVRLIESSECMVFTDGGLQLVLQGLDGYIVAEHEGVLLVCKREEEQRISEFSAGISR
ncbi:MAG: mannose-1-phosphate guanylyltransferase [Culturomica sp.]|jgi:mannose-1-phosphate guanylyltransferase|nr:mannose-1-phosphate guanylyltransferase [Culturomica sp.]